MKKDACSGAATDSTLALLSGVSSGAERPETEGLVASSFCGRARLLLLALCGLFHLGVLVNLLIQVVVVGRRGTVDAEPPVAGEDLLVEDRTVGAEVRGHVVGFADVVQLTVILNVSIISGQLPCA